MLEVRIQEFKTTYQLPQSALAEQRRLDQLRTRVVDQAFAQAIEKAGLPDDGELCIRNLRAPVILRLAATNESLVAHWSMALAQEIVDAIRNVSAGGAVIYHSRRQALLDLAIGVGRGDLGRAWAWRQLGLWRSGVADAAAFERQAVSELTRSLCNEPTMVVPILSALAESGWLQRIAGQLSVAQWTELAVAALYEIGAVDSLNQPEGIPSAGAVREAWRVVNRSRLLRAIASSSWLVDASVEIRRAVAVLAVLDTEPMLLRAPTAATLISIVADAVRPLPQQSIAEQRLRERSGSDSVERDADPPAKDKVDAPVSRKSDRTSKNSSDGKQRQQEVDSEIAEIRAAETQANDESTRAQAPGTVAKQLVGPKERAMPAANEDAILAAKGDAILAATETAIVGPIEAEPPLDLRRRAFTNLGGLLFLLNAVEDLNLPEAILEHPFLGARRFVWVIHQLALTLSLADASDPAVLAFAGLPPDAPPPSEQEVPPTGIEAKALAELAAMIIDSVGSRLAFEDEPLVNVCEFVCCRRAEIVADPGWIEARLSLEEVSTEIRRAGLDLDPGYLPWLGVVVRFVYE